MIARLFMQLLNLALVSAMYLPGDAISFTHSAAITVGRYDVFELTVAYPTREMSNPWEDASVTATFKSPSGTNLHVDGFYYDADTFKVRFTPAEIGVYSYTGSISGPAGQRNFSGSFQSVASSNKGFIRRVPGSTTRLQFEDGTFFAGAGFNDCWNEHSPPDGQWGVIGASDIEPPGEKGRVSVDDYFAKYGDGEGKYNLLRWNPGNCSYGIYQTLSPQGNTYDLTHGQSGDVLLATAKRHGFHVLFTFFYNVPYNGASGDTPQASAVKRYFRYVMARYGAYVDMWELTNETDTNDVSDAWMTWTTSYIRSIDPYHRLITNSNPRPNDSSYLDIQSPHLYGNFADLHDFNNQTPSLPRVVGESGAQRDPVAESSEYQQDFQRVQLWTAIFGGTGIIWWNGGWRYPQPVNMYLGSKARVTNRTLQDLVNGLDVSAVSAKPGVQGSGVVAYSLTGTHKVLVYVTRYAGPHESASTTLTLNIPFENGSAEWLDPSTGKPIRTFGLADRGSQVLTTPPFTADVALKVVDRPSSNSAPYQ